MSWDESDDVGEWGSGSSALLLLVAGVYWLFPRVMTKFLPLAYVLARRSGHIEPAAGGRG